MVIFMPKIRESPDGGTTVYERDFGSTERTLTEESKSRHNSLIASMQENKLWGAIRRAAKTNPALQDALDRAIVIYELSKNNG